MTNEIQGVLIRSGFAVVYFAAGYLVASCRLRKEGEARARSAEAAVVAEAKRCADKLEMELSLETVHPKAEYRALIAAVRKLGGH